MPEKPRNPDFEDAVRQSFARQSLMRLLGAQLEDVAAGAIVVSLPCHERLSQQSGVVHAGVIATIADSACGYAAMSLMPAGSEVVSVEFKLNLLAPARGDRLEARARVIRSGATLSVCTADVFAIERGTETLVATMMATMMRRDSGPLLATKKAGGTMAKDRSNQGGPTHNPKDEPTADRSHRNATSRDELKERSVQGERPGKGRRNASAKHR